MDLYILGGDDGHTPIRCKDLFIFNQHNFEHFVERIVAKTQTSNGQVSTVFLGIDHNFWGGPPILFETMVFGGTHDGEQERYTTWHDAEVGHAAWVIYVTDKI